MRARGVPLPHLSWDLFWGQRGKPRLGPLKQEKLELALNSERVCWGLASCGLPQASRQAVGLCVLGSQAAGQAAASSSGLAAFLPPRAAMGVEEAGHRTGRQRAAEGVGVWGGKGASHPANHTGKNFQNLKRMCNFLKRSQPTLAYTVSCSSERSAGENRR